MFFVLLWSGPTYCDRDQRQDHAVQEQDGGWGRFEAASGQSGGICGAPWTHEETGHSLATAWSILFPWVDCDLLLSVWTVFLFWHASALRNFCFYGVWMEMVMFCGPVNTVVLSPSGFGRVWDVQTENGGLPALHWGPAHTESGFYEQRGKALRATHTHALAWQRAATALQESLIMYWMHLNEFLNRTLTGL